MDQSFNDVFIGLSPYLHRFFVQGVGDCQGDKAQTAWDMLQETAKCAVPYCDDPKYKHRLSDLIWIVARNVLSKYKRESGRRIDLHGGIAAMDRINFKDPTDDYTRAYDREAYLKGLKEVDQRIVQMRWHGYTYAEIGVKLGMSEDSVKKRAQRLKS